MHVVQSILVEEPGLDPAMIGEDFSIDVPEGWWDYYSVGGRWDGYFGEKHGDVWPALREHPNVIPVAEFPDAALRELEAVVARQDHAFLSARNNLTGSVVGVADLDGHVFGFPVAPSEEIAERMTQSHRQMAAAWAGVLQAGSLIEAREVPNNGMAAYYARNMIRLLDGEWFADSGFYDRVAGGALPRYLMDALRGDTSAASYYPKDFKDLFLVTVDFHY